MRPFIIDQLARSTVADLNRQRTRIDLSPSYQRQGDVWGLAKRQLFIDSMLNGFDVPKLYFHDISELSTRKGYKYAVVDGKQRLDTIWSFIDDELELSDDFLWHEDPELAVGPKKYSQLPPKLQARFDDYRLPVQVIHTDDLQWVEELFTRLNEAVALNAPERRNAKGGPLPPIIRTLPTHEFFSDRLPFENNRYKHMDLAAKFLFFEHVRGAASTKRRVLDDFVIEYKDHGWLKEARALETKTLSVLDRLAGVFGEEDDLLRSLGLVVVFYLLERDKVLSSNADSREILASFDELRRQVRILMRPSESRRRVKLDQELVEFERLSQSPNDSGGMITRMNVLKKFLADPKLIKASLRALR